MLAFLLLASTLARNPESTHSFVYHGKPIVLLTAGEHYGAVINRDFDYVPYLDELQHDHLNLTRIFAFFRELPTSIKGLKYTNTLAPQPGREILPWKRVGTKYDLTQWEPAYFARLKDFVAQAAQRGIVVEVSLFTKLYGQDQWELLPFYKTSNVNGVGKTLTSYMQLLEMYEPATFEAQKAFTRKMVAELNGFDNVYFEISNETATRNPERGPTQKQVAWHLWLAGVVRDTEKNLPKKHLVAINAHQKILSYKENGKEYVESGDDAYFTSPLLDVLNYHYLGRKTVGRGLAAIDPGMGPPRPGNIWRYLAARVGVNKALVYDENYSGVVAGAAPIWDRNRMEAWETLLSGAAGFDHLEWSFTPEDPRGLPSRPFRAQLGALADYWRELGPGEMRPDRELVISTPANTDGYASTRRDGSRQVVYVADVRDDKSGFGAPVSGAVQLRLAAGRYEVRTLCSGATAWSAPIPVGVDRGTATVPLPEFRRDCALDLRRLAK